MTMQKAQAADGRVCRFGERANRGRNGLSSIANV